MHRATLSLLILILFGVVFVPAQESSTKAFDRTKFEREVAILINSARKEPDLFAKLIRSYQSHYSNGLLRLPGFPGRRLFEGDVALKEAAAALSEAKPVPSLCRTNLLDEMANMQLSDLLVDNSIGHTGLDGSTLRDRLKRRGTYTGPVGETIANWATTPEQAVASLLIDDGVSNRVHRGIVLRPDFKEFGIACAMSKKNSPFCVLVFANSFVPKTKSKPTRLSPDTGNGE